MYYITLYRKFVPQHTTIEKQKEIIFRLSLLLHIACYSLCVNQKKQ